MKLIKKVIVLITILTFVIPNFGFVILNANDDNKTLQDLIDELNAKQSELNAVKEDKSMTESQITKIQNNIYSINDEILTIEETVKTLNEQIVKLNEEIVKKDEEVKKAINQYQLSSGNDAYIEYIMTSATITDFIFRMAIVEQVAVHNQDLIDEMDDMIKETENKTVELKTKKSEISNKKVVLFSEQFKLGDKAEQLEEHSIGLEQEIKDAIKTIESYKKIYNCKPTDRIKDCTSFPIDSSFIRPLNYGRITSEFGWRGHPVYGNYSFHTGLDIGGNSTGTPVYPVAGGRVALTGFWGCGGNYLIIQHNVNGKNYTSRYLHLHTIDVKMGDTVTKATQIATVGGGESYDRCTTGPHLHMDIAEGLYGSDFISFGRTGPIVNPRSLLEFPGTGIYFSGRW